MSLRLKLLLLGLATLVLPWAGCRYAREMESALRQGEADSLQARRADHRHLAAGAHRPALPRRRRARVPRTPTAHADSVRQRRAAEPPRIRTSTSATPYDLEPVTLTAAPLLDGYVDDWPRDPAAWTHFDQDARHRFAILTGVHERMLYVLLEVHDEHPLFDAPGSNPLEPCDLRRPRVARLRGPQGEQQQVFLAATAPGAVQRAAHRERRVRPPERRVSSRASAAPGRPAAEGYRRRGCACRCR